MPEIGNTSVFSQTDASNGTGTMPSWLGSAAPSTLDDAGRALQGAVTREWNWRNYTLTAAGTSDAKTLTYSVAPAAYYNGQRFAFIANTANTTTVTLNVNALGAKTIKKMLGGTATNLAAGEMPAGAYVEVAYNTAGDYFVWLNSTLPIYSDSSGNVGVGTRTPGVQFEISDGTVRQAAGYLFSSAAYTGTISNHNWGILTNNSIRATMDTSGNFLLISTGGLGYGTGSGGTVTQITSRTTGVTLNKTNGLITLVTTAGISSWLSFTVTNSTVAATDVVVLSVSQATNTYVAFVSAVNAGSFNVTFSSVVGTASDTPKIGFAVIKAVTA